MLKPDLQLLKQLPFRGIDVTAPASNSDFVCRTFYPKKKTANEDAVCGAAHCLLIPYWAQELNKLKLLSHQVSERGGELVCYLENENVLIGGNSVIDRESNFLLENTVDPSAKSSRLTL
jgi:predicted PhzF superfamily epimerase YddE/YHI9